MTDSHSHKDTEERFRVFDDWFDLLEVAESLIGVPSDAKGTRERIKAFMLWEIEHAYAEGRKDAVEYIRANSWDTTERYSRESRWGLDESTLVEAAKGDLVDKG